MKAKEYIGLLTIVGGAIAATYIIKKVFFSDDKKSNVRGFTRAFRPITKFQCWCIDGKGGGALQWCPCDAGWKEIYREDVK